MTIRMVQVTLSEMSVGVARHALEKEYERLRTTRGTRPSIRAVEMAEVQQVLDAFDDLEVIEVSSGETHRQETSQVRDPGNVGGEETSIPRSTAPMVDEPEKD